jgi:hypothetical protein
MRYRIVSSKDGRTILTLSMPERAIVVILLVIIGLFCLMVGVGYTIPDGGGMDPMRALFFIGFGLLCFCAIFFLSTGTVLPKRLVFDDAEGWLLTEDRKGGREKAIPYGGIAGFSVAAARRDTMNLHSVGIDVGKGGRWELYTSRHAIAAEHFKEALLATVQLDSPTIGERAAPTGMTGTKLPGGKVRFEWKRRARPVSLVASLVTLLSFCGTFAAIRPLVSGTAAYVIALAFVTVLLAVVAAGAVRTAGERMRVEVDPKTVSWWKSSAFIREKARSMRIAEIASVDLSFSFARMESAVALLHADEIERFTRYRQGTFSPVEAFGILRFLRSLTRIDVSALALGDRVALAEAIRSWK